LIDFVTNYLLRRAIGDLFNVNATLSRAQNCIASRRSIDYDAYVSFVLAAKPLLDKDLRDVFSLYCH